VRRFGQLPAVAFLVVAWLGAADAQTPGSDPPIGTAQMMSDGTVVLDLRATGPGTIVGHGRLTYPPGHPERQAVIDHLGGLRPGETKPVAPWPDPPARPAR